jgi:hypothetical protein
MSQSPGGTISQFFREICSRGSSDGSTLHSTRQYKIFGVTRQYKIFGIFPDNLKVARVSPIYKEGDKEERGNYRPISVLSTVAKLFEKFVCIQLTDYLNANDILSPCQSGFRQNHSTMSSLLS